MNPGVRAARAAAAVGVTAARFDWRGTGESLGVTERFDLDAPYFADVECVIEELKSVGAARLALSGICFGAFSALVAAENDLSVERLVLISLPFPSDRTKTDHKADRLSTSSALKLAWRPAVLSSLMRNPAMRDAAWRGIKRKVFRSSGPATTIPTRRTTEAVPGILRRLADRGIEIDLIFGEQDLEYAAYRALSEADPLPVSIRVATIPGDLSNFGTLAAQDAAVDAIVRALSR